MYRVHDSMTRRQNLPRPVLVHACKCHQSMAEGTLWSRHVDLAPRHDDDGCTRPTDAILW